MDIAQMHVWFRQYAQQMGLQNVRAILPEQIDLLINTSISDTVNDIIRQSVAVTNDRTPNDSSKVGQINALRTLYKTVDLPFSTKLIEDTLSAGGRFYTNIFCDDNNITLTIYKYETITHEGTAPTNTKFTEYITTFSDGTAPVINTETTNTDEDVKPRTLVDITHQSSGEQATLGMLYLVDLSIRYKRNTIGKYTNYFPVRLIDDVYLADTLNDFVMKPRVRTPIAIMSNKRIEVYLGEDYKKGNGILSTDVLVPWELRVSYLAKPAVVAYRQDIGQPNTDCDLPEALHVDVLKHAVDLYRISVSGALNATAGQMREQQQPQGNYSSNQNAYQ